MAHAPTAFRPVASDQGESRRSPRVCCPNSAAVLRGGAEAVGPVPDPAQHLLAHHEADGLEGLDRRSSMSPCDPFLSEEGVSAQA